MKPKKPFELKFFNYAVSSDALSTDTSNDQPDITEALQWTKGGKMRLVQIWKELQIGVIQNGRCFLSSRDYNFPVCLPGDKRGSKKEKEPFEKERPVIVDGVTYPSIIATRTAFGFKHNGSVRWRCDHKELWPNWQWGDIAP